MNDVVHFSEAARVYAEHVAVVELMQSQFREAVAAFLHTIAAELRAMVVPETFHEKETGASYRYWWLADEAGEMENHPLLWLDTRQAAIVRDGQLAITVCAPRASAVERMRYVSVSKAPSLAEYCKAGKGGTWSLFTFTVTYAEGDAIKHIAEPLGRLLLDLREVERSFKEITSHP